MCETGGSTDRKGSVIRGDCQWLRGFFLGCWKLAEVITARPRACTAAHQVVSRCGELRRGDCPWRSWLAGRVSPILGRQPRALCLSPGHNVTIALSPDSGSRRTSGSCRQGVGDVEKAGGPGQWLSLGQGGSRGKSCHVTKSSVREGAELRGPRPLVAPRPCPTHAEACRRWACVCVCRA